MKITENTQFEEVASKTKQIFLLNKEKEKRENTTLIKNWLQVECVENVEGIVFQLCDLRNYLNQQRNVSLSIKGLLLFLESIIQYGERQSGWFQNHPISYETREEKIRKFLSVTTKEDILAFFDFSNRSHLQNSTTWIDTSSFSYFYQKMLNIPETSEESLKK